MNGYSLRSAATLFGAATLAATLMAGTPVLASEQTDLLAQAATTAHHLKTDPSFGQARTMLDHARAVMIVPGLVKGGFIFGAEGGDGVLLARLKSGWSQPAFYGMGSASFGLQAGLEKAQIVLIINSEKGLKALENNEFKLGANAGLTVATLSAGAEGATAGGTPADIVVWTSATGAYGGLTINGSIIKPRNDWNEAFYGKPASVDEILTGKVTPAPASMSLRQELAMK